MQENYVRMYQEVNKLIDLKKASTTLKIQDPPLRNLCISKNNSIVSLVFESRKATPELGILHPLPTHKVIFILKDKSLIPQFAQTGDVKVDIRKDPDLYDFLLERANYLLGEISQGEYQNLSKTPNQEYYRIQSNLILKDRSLQKGQIISEAEFAKIPEKYHRKFTEVKVTLEEKSDVKIGNVKTPDKKTETKYLAQANVFPANADRVIEAGSMLTKAEYAKLTERQKNKFKKVDEFVDLE
jgi:hypothetical protein